MLHLPQICKIFKIVRFLKFFSVLLHLLILVLFKRSSNTYSLKMRPPKVVCLFHFVNQK